MTEAEWLVCDDPAPMLAHLGNRLGERKLLLFGLAIVRRREDLLDLYGARRALELVERYADGQATEANLVDELARFPTLLGALPRVDVTALTFVAEWLQRLDNLPSGRRRERRTQADRLRDIAGNPFRRSRVAPAWLEAEGGLVLHLARVAAEERSGPEGLLDNARLAVLGDALEDAGCSDHTILAHLHEPGAHVRGCWVLDRLLARD